MLPSRVALHAFHLNEVRPDLVDAMPDPSPGRRVDELASGALLQACPTVALHVHGVRAKSACQCADVPYHKKATLAGPWVPAK